MKRRLVQRALIMGAAALMLAGCVLGRGCGELGDSCKNDNSCRNARCQGGICTKICKTDADCAGSPAKLVCKSDVCAKP